ncbi:MAG: hypothetical protein RIC04_07250 [Parvibaculum sp.]|uniref:hypothetical protein n=1 Tax=Parvibaculum sp. TaxID=2024848 RepID=UPI0032EC7552
MSNFMKTAIAIIVLAVVLVIGYRMMNPEDATVGDAVDTMMEDAGDAADAMGEAASDAMDATEEAASDAMDAAEDAMDATEEAAEDTGAAAEGAMDNMSGDNAGGEAVEEEAVE